MSVCVWGGRAGGGRQSLWGLLFTQALLCLCRCPHTFPAVLAASCLGVEFLSPVWPRALDRMTQILVCCLRVFSLPAAVGDGLPTAGTGSGSIPAPVSPSAAQCPWEKRGCLGAVRGPEGTPGCRGRCAPFRGKRRLWASPGGSGWQWGFCRGDCRCAGWGAVGDRQSPGLPSLLLVSPGGPAGFRA